ncbi:hypothetical protein MMC17_002267 [Xylographa soralifera]|nr:hypothetical protein [Xylographa soralifera]
MPSYTSVLFRGLAIVLTLGPNVFAISNNDSTVNPPYDGYFKTLAQTYYPPNADCQDYMIPVSIEWDKFVFNGTEWQDNDGLQDFLSVVTAREPGPNYPSPLGESTTINGTYQIAATFCSPKQASEKAKTVIVATHGIGPARNHWNSAFQPDDYNFVQFATNQGYSVFFYDRLGCGASDKISGFDAQISTAIAVLQRLTGLVRDGQYTGAVGKPRKVALLGFSFGSYTTHGAIALTPAMADAVVLTAIGFNSTGLNVNGLVRSYGLRVASQQNAALYGDRDAGYLTWVDRSAQIMNYFKRPSYDDAAVDFAEAAKQPFAVAEFLTLLAGPQDVSGYAGPALHLTGEYDYIFCDGFCPGIFEEPARSIYKNAKLQLALQPGASHNINFHHNATGAYKVITDFLEASGL